jgi:hypothetical protein
MTSSDMTRGLYEVRRCLPIFPARSAQLTSLPSDLTVSLYQTGSSVRVISPCLFSS